MLFRNELDALFSSDRHALLKILGGGLVGAILGVKSAFDPEFNLSTPMAALVTLIVSVVAMIVVSALLLRDVVHQRIQAGYRVNRLLKWYLCKGWISFILWISSALVTAILLAAAL